MTASITTLTAVSGLLGWSPTAEPTTTMPSWTSIRSDVLTAVSGKLGISAADLTSQLKTGKSMAQLASTAGVSSNDLTLTIQGSLAQSNLPAGVNLATMATGMANNVNNASLDYTPSPAPTTSGSSLGIDTSALQDVRVGGLSLGSSEITMLLGSRGSTLDSYL